jgi:hypothetical protein
MPIPLRNDFDAKIVRSAAKRSKDGPQTRRLLALAAIYEGATRIEAAKMGGGETVKSLRSATPLASGPMYLNIHVNLSSAIGSRFARNLTPANSLF